MAGPTSSSASVGFVVDTQAAASRVGYPTQRFALRMQPYTLRDGGQRTNLAEPTIVVLGTAAVKRTPATITFDVGHCFSDAARARSGESCPLRLDVALLLENGGLVLDHQLAGPWPAAAGIVPHLDTLRLAEVGPPDVFPRTPSLAVGGSLSMFAQFVTVAGAVVTRPVTWRSESPTAATVDEAGRVTARARGATVVTAIFGAGQSSNGQLLTVH